MKQVQAESLKAYQLVHKLNVTGNIDNATLKLLNTPRCGLGDFSNNVRVAKFKACINNQFIMLF